MADKFDQLDQKHQDFIKAQKLFFVSTAGTDGFINLSPKGMDSFRIINNKKVIWLNLTGSGNETATHLIENNRMTIMFCSFDKRPLILRLYVRAKVIHPKDENWNKNFHLFPNHTGARQIFECDLDLAVTSCGYSIPFYEFKGERETLTKWSEKKGESGIQNYWKEKNQLSLDGKKTDLFYKN